jgi:hypothetical protein
MKLKLLAAALALCSGQAYANTCGPLQAGATDQTVYVEMLDNTTGLPTAGLAFDSSGIDLEYVRTGAAAVDITEATQTANGAHSDGGFVSVGHGRYRLDLPDAAVATGVTQVVVQGIITGYTMAPCVVALSPPVNVVRFGGTDGTFSGGRPEVNVSHWGGTVIASALVRANLIQVNSDATAAANLEAWLDLIAGNANGSLPAMGITASGTAQSYSAPDLVLAAATAAANDDFNGNTALVWGSNESDIQTGCVSDFVGATDTVTFDANLNTAPTGTIRYVLFGTKSCAAGGGSGATAQEVWEYATRELTALDEDVTNIDINNQNVLGTVNTVNANIVSAADGALGVDDFHADVILTPDEVQGLLDAGVFTLGFVTAGGDVCTVIISESEPHLTLDCTEAP